MCSRFLSCFLLFAGLAGGGSSASCASARIRIIFRFRTSAVKVSRTGWPS